MGDEIHEQVDTLQFRDPNQPNLHLVYWTRKPLQRKEKPNILFWNHGIGEHSGRHKCIAKHMLANVPLLDAVISYDMRGHGESQGARGSPTSLDDLIADVTLHVLPHTALRYGVGATVVIGGHSLGGAVVAGVAVQRDVLLAEDCGRIAGVILSAPALQVCIHGVVNSVLAPVAGVLAKAGLRGMVKASGIKTADLCHDDTVIRAYEADKLVHDRVSLGLAADMQVVCKTLTDRLAATDDCVLRAGVPTLVLHSPDDNICDVAGARRFVDAVKKFDAANIKLVEVAGAGHEIHNETAEQGSDLFFASMVEHLNQIFPPGESERDAGGAQQDGAEVAEVAEGAEVAEVAEDSENAKGDATAEGGDAEEGAE